ncbi:MAG: HD domain-containing protein [Candidatus Marinimicrobia bacterium]|nr:HD domain-containing protein [Candidatus Neomarinimicrobiota bacterium]
MKNLLEETEKWIKKGPNVLHLRRTGYWVKKMDPDVDEAVLIAALTHDMDRAFAGPDEIKFPSGLSQKKYNELYKKHGLRAARIVGEFLEEKGVDKKFISKVKKLIEKHEFGGTDEENLVKDADSLSFLENNISVFIGFIPKSRDKKDIERKFEYMFNRISSPKAKQMAKSFYEKAKVELEKV